MYDLVIKGDPPTTQKVVFSLSSGSKGTVYLRINGCGTILFTPEGKMIVYNCNQNELLVDRLENLNANVIYDVRKNT